MPHADASGHQARPHLATALANLVVGVLREHTGRGPTKARAHVCEDVIAVILHNTLTRAERTLAANGGADIVLATRRAFRDPMRPDLVAGVERLTARTVIACFSDNTIDPDMALELFLLAPQDAAQPVAVGT